MNNLENISCNIYRIPTQKEAVVGDILELNGVLIIAEQHFLMFKPEGNQLGKEWKPYYLYITSDEEIKEGDYSIVFGKVDKVITANKDATSVVFENAGLLFDRKSFPKIIATNDSKLNETDRYNGKAWDDLLPYIPNYFINKYVESNGEIVEVFVEYEIVKFTKSGVPVKYSTEETINHKILKVSPLNTINII